MKKVYGSLALSVLLGLIFIPSVATVLYLIYNYAQPIVLGFISVWVAVLSCMGCIAFFITAYETYNELKEKEKHGDCIDHEG